jgi:hypothetical protein
MPASTKRPHPIEATSQKPTNRLLAVCFYLLSALRGKQRSPHISRAITPGMFAPILISQRQNSSHHRLQKLKAGYKLIDSLITKRLFR